MSQRWVLVLCGLISAALQGIAQIDTEGGKDHALFTRMPGFFISVYTQQDFGKCESPYLEGKDKVWEGKFTDITYALKDGARAPGMLSIERNYENAIKKVGGTILYSDDRVVEGKIRRDGADTYVHIEAFNEGASYVVKIVEPKPMKQEVEADASALSTSIAQTGKAMVYGIFFDTGKAVVKPESEPSLKEIAKLLKQNEVLSVYVVGHTDYVGSLESNLKLSSDRADAIVRALIGKGVAASRLKPVGVGPYCPVASNRTEEGKARNRRVELVEQK
jgi:OmpA-OmpF porin, OOP family